MPILPLLIKAGNVVSVCPLVVEDPVIGSKSSGSVSMAYISMAHMTPYGPIAAFFSKIENKQMGRRHWLLRYLHIVVVIRRIWCSLCWHILLLAPCPLLSVVPSVGIVGRKIVSIFLVL